MDTDQDKQDAERIRADGIEVRIGRLSEYRQRPQSLASPRLPTEPPPPPKENPKDQTNNR